MTDDSWNVKYVIAPIRHPLGHANTTDTKDENPEEQDYERYRHPPRNGISTRASKINPQPSSHDSNEANHKLWNAKQWKQRLIDLSLENWLAIIGLVVVISYTTLTFLQLSEAVKSNRLVNVPR